MAVVLLWAAPVAVSAQARPTPPPAPANAPPSGAPAAQEVPRPGTLHRFWLRDGDQVRFTEPGRRLDRAEGRLVGGAHTEGLTLVRGDRAETIPFAALTSLEVRRGQRHTWKGALVGAVIGGLAYLATGEAWDDDRSTEHKVKHAAWMTGGGFVAGALVGGLAWHPHWRTVDLPATGSPAVSPAPGGVKGADAARGGPPSLVSLRLRF